MTRILPLLALVLLAAACSPQGADDEAPQESSTTQIETAPETSSAESFAGTTPAPEFPDGLEWINAGAPVTLDSLKGKVVLLDFWTYGCINCIHIIPDLERLEAEYPDELVVIGVHSAKFANEGDTNQLRDIVQRYGLEHPVVNDKGFTVWNAWGANAWPTIALIDPASKVVGIRSGEGVYDAVEPVIAGLVAEFDAAGALDRAPIHFALEADTAPRRALNYPGKVLAVDGRLWVADTGHNRVLEIDPVTGDVLAAYGSGSRGVQDGPGAQASFDAPQGLAYSAGTLYVADTDNHLIRAIDLSSGAVTTIAGTGELGYPAREGPALMVGLNSPWAVLFDEGTLYVANAGSHQIVSIDLSSAFVTPLVGNAGESTTNGPFASAELAQPSGLALSDKGVLYFADSESSSIRAADLTAETVHLVVGGDATLFEFGDENGQGNKARLQHPLGTALGGETLYVADTYNSKIKRVDIATNTVTSWLGATPGWADGTQPQFNEPGGLSFSDGLLYIADTNNHAIRVVNVATGDTSTLILKGAEKFDPPGEFRGEVITLEQIEANAGAASMTLNYTLPDGYKVNEEAPSTLTIAGGGVIASLPAGATYDLTGTDLPVSVPVELVEGSATVVFDVTLIYCETVATSLCLIDQTRFEVPMDVGSSGASTQITLNRTIPDPNL
ncbi:MAG: redoxin domain-containing protein [Actinomycetia bacterium]|nr:redoxin domain-containing protein [Actinomycetes bacterium]